jgi:hypothetical protein
LPVVLTAMGKQLFKAPDGGYYEIVRVTEGSTQSELQQGPETSLLLDQKVRPEAFPSGLTMSVWSLSRGLTIQMDSDRISKKGSLPVIRRAAGRNFRFQGVKG